MYLNLIQIAESFGVSEKVVEDWVRAEALPYMNDRGRLLFDRAQVANWATARGLAAHAGFLAPSHAAFATAWKIAPLLRAGGIWRNVPASGVTEACLRIVSALPGITPPVRDLLSRRLRAPGGLTYAPVGGGFALPHPSTRVALGRASGTVALLLLSGPLPLTEPRPDDLPVTRLIFFVAPSPRAHLDLLGRISRMIGRGPVRDAIMDGAGDEEILTAVQRCEQAPPAGTTGGEVAV